MSGVAVRKTNDNEYAAPRGAAGKVGSTIRNFVQQDAVLPDQSISKEPSVSNLYGVSTRTEGEDRGSKTGKKIRYKNQSKIKALARLRLQERKLHQVRSIRARCLGRVDVLMESFWLHAPQRVKECLGQMYVKPYSGVDAIQEPKDCNGSWSGKTTSRFIGSLLKKLSTKKEISISWSYLLKHHSKLKKVQECLCVWKAAGQQISKGSISEVLVAKLMFCCQWAAQRVAQHKKWIEACKKIQIVNQCFSFHVFSRKSFNLRLDIKSTLTHQIHTIPNALSV